METKTVITTEESNEMSKKIKTLLTKIVTNHNNTWFTPNRKHAYLTEEERKLRIMDIRVSQTESMGDEPMWAFNMTVDVPLGRKITLYGVNELVNAIRSYSCNVDDKDVMISHENISIRGSVPNLIIIV